MAQLGHGGRAETAQVSRAAEAEAGAEAETERTAAEEAEAAELAAAQEEYAACRRQIHPLLDALQVDARLSVGLSQSELSNLVGGCVGGVLQDRPTGPGRRPLLELWSQAGERIERILAHGELMERVHLEYSCDLDDIDPQLQRAWASAGSIERAEDLLIRLDPDNPSYVPASGSQP